jgi:hypothetical protein
MKLTAIFLFAAALSQGASLILLRPEQAARMKTTIQKGDPAGGHLRHAADAALKAGPWSVTFSRPKNPDIGLNEYYSEGPYWWPDPKNPKAPYIRKDGERNPARFMGNRGPIGEMSAAVLALGAAAYFFDDARFAQQCARVLNVWFVDPKTRMSPNLEYGQAVHGVKDSGRSSGMIDTVSLIHAVQGIALLEQSGKWNDVGAQASLRKWFADYARWMNTSEKGIGEKNAKNNHGTWWTAQVAAYAAFTGDEAMRRMAYDRLRTHLVPVQIQPDGSCPAEEARTKSIGYSTMNLDGFSVLCRIAQLDGVDLWHFKGPKGVGPEKAFHYLAPYLANPSSWKKQQIEKFENKSSIFLGLAGLGLPSPELLKVYRALPRSDGAWVQLIDLLVRAGN